MKNNKFSSLLKEWYEGNISFDERMNIETEKPVIKKEETTEKPKIRLVKDVENAEEKLKNFELGEEKIEQLVQEKKDLVLHQDYEQAAIVRDKVIELKNKLEIYRNFWKENGGARQQHITARDVCKIVAEITGIPVEQLDSTETKRLIKMEEELHKSVIGQHDAVHLISSAVRRNRSGISSPNTNLVVSDT